MIRQNVALLLRYKAIYRVVLCFEATYRDFTMDVYEQLLGGFMRRKAVSPKCGVEAKGCLSVRVQ